MKLTQEHKDAVKRWATEGAGLSEIQSRLLEEFNVSLSYMETRFLVIDLEATIQDPPSPEEKKPEQAMQTDDIDGEEDIETEALPPEGEVLVDINPITRPGFAVTGTIVFSDGIKGEWGVTADGRLSLEPEEPEYRPTPEDVRAFQVKLRELFASQGMG